MAEGSSDSLVKDAIVSVLYDTSGPQVNVKGISQDLVRENVIDVSLEQRILSQQTDSDSQRVLAQHLHNFGILESIKRLCRVLRSTANRYHSHASVAEKLDKACGFSSLTAHSREKSGSHTPGELRNSEMSEEEIIEIFRGASSQLKEHYEMLVPVPPKSHRPTLDYIELAVINRGGEKMKNELQVKNFLDAALRGIDAIYKRLNSIKYVEILKVDKKCPTTGRRIVISGAPGCGKSTLSRQLCKDLSSRTLDNTYQLVILVELRELVYRMKEGEELGLKHLLMKYPYLSSKKVFNALLYDYGKNVLFILDGYDELDESLRSCQFLRDILSPSNPSLFLYKCDVVITTRPVTSGELFELVENPYRNVEILGFTEEHIHVYIDKYFENLENGRMKADKLKEKLEQLPHVRGMCRVPIVLEFVCKVHHLLGDQGIPDTQTGIYGTYVVTELFNSKPGPFNGKPPSQVSVQDLLIVSEEDFPGFSELCRKAFECCSSTKGQRLLLTEQDVSDLTQYLNRGSIYGLLFAETVESVCGSVRLFHYLHKSIQEMLAAVHIAKLPDEKHIPLWRDQFGRPEMAEIWKYYAGITELKKLDTNTLLDIFRKIREDQEIILMLSLYEANNQEVAKKVLPVMFSENKISITARSSYEIVAANYCIKHHPSLASFKLKLIGREIKFGKPLKDAACQISSHPTLKSLKCSGFKEKDWTLFSDGLVPCKSVSIFDIEDPTSAILGSIAKNSFDSPDSTLVCHYQLQDNTPVDEKELCEAWSQCKCKTVKIRLKADRYDHSDQLNSLTRPVLKGISVNGHVQHLVFDCLDSPIQLHGNHEEYHEWLSLLKQLLVPCLTCQLRLHLSPAEWAAILCGVGGAEQLEKLDVDMTFTDDNTPVDEKELCEAWSQCKCTTVKMLIDYDTYPAQRGLPLILSVLKGISVNGHVQHLVLSHKDLSELPHDDRKEYHDWMSLPEQLLVPRLTCQLVLRLSPAEWAAILCVVGGAEQLEELDVTMEFTDDNTPVDEKGLCEAWSQCKCKTVKILIPCQLYLTARGASLTRSVLKGISVNGHVQHLVFEDEESLLQLHGNHEESHEWLSLLKQLLVLRLTCQLRLHLSPAEWAAILCGVGDAEQLEELDVTMRFTDGNTPVDEKELCEAWSQCKCKTVKMWIGYHTEFTEGVASLARSVLKGISVNGHVQHLVFFNWNRPLPLHGNPEESHDWMSLLKQLLVPRLTCQLRLLLSPAEWAAILCGVGGAEQLKKLDVTMSFTDDSTPVDEKELCEAWSQCKCKTVKMGIGDYTAHTPQGVSLLTGVLGGIAQNKTSVEFKLEFWHSKIQSYYMERIPGDILTHFTRDGKTLTLNPLNSRCPTGGVSSWESPQTPGSNPTGEPSNKRRHMEQPPLVGVTETGQSLSLSSFATPRDIPQLMDTSPMIFPAHHPPRDVQTLTGPPQRASSQYLSSSGGPQQSYSPPVPLVAQRMTRTPHPLAQFSQHMYIPRRPRGPGPHHYSSQGPGPHHYSSQGPGPLHCSSQGPGMQQHIQNLQSVRHLQPSFHYSQSRPNLHGIEAPFSPPQVPGPHRSGMSQHIPFQTHQYRHTSLQPGQYSQTPSHPSRPRPGSLSDSSWGYPVHTPPPPQGPLPTEDLPGPSSLSYPPQYCEPHPPYPSTHYSQPPTLSGGSGFDCRQFMEKYKDRFLQFVDSRAIAIRLSLQDVIPSDLFYRLENVDSTTGTQLLFLHLRSHADRDSLLELCNVMINLTGYPNISSLGRDMKRDLEQPVNTSTS